MLALVFGSILTAFRGNFHPGEQMLISGVLFLVAVAFVSVLLPLIYRFGVERGRLFIMVVFAAPMAAFFVLSNAGLQPPPEEIVKLILWITPFAVALLFCLSFALSNRIYRKKDI